MGKDPAFVKGFLGEVLRESTIHGVKYIGLPNRHISERIFWIVAVLALFGFSVYLVEDVYTKFFANPVIISFQPMETDISQIPFPAVTLCNVNILKRKVMREIVETLYDEHAKLSTANVTEAYYNALILAEHLTHYCLAAPSFRRMINESLVDAYGVGDTLKEIHEYLEKIVAQDYMNVGYDELSKEMRHKLHHFLDEAAHECEDMILKCMWAREEVDCREMFVPIHTSSGSCCVWNLMPKFIMRNIPDNDSRAEKEKKLWSEEAIAEWKKFGGNGKIVDFDEEDEIHYPKHQHSGGKPYGLSILINPEIDTYGTCNTNDAWGFKMIAHSPISYPAIMDYGVAIPPNSEVFVDVEPTLSLAQDSLRSIDVDKRGCYFPDEEKAQLTSYKFYSSANCQDECIARITYRNCSCVRYFMPRNKTQKLCGAKKLKCAESVRENLTRTGRLGHCSVCKPACTEIQYKLHLSHFPLRENETVPYILYNTSTQMNKKARNYSIVHVYFGTDQVYAKERKRLYDNADLLANAGGLLSLTLGFSIVSLVEIFYFCTMRAYFYFKSNAEEKDKEGRDKPKPVAVIRPRIQDGLHDKTMVGYYNWAIQSPGAIQQVVVKSKDKRSGPVLRRKVSPTQLLKGKNNGGELRFEYMD